MNKDDILSQLRDQIKNLLVSLEEQTGLSIQFESFNSIVVAGYQFIVPKTVIIRLRADWKDIDVAHELMHMKLELIDRFSVLGWRDGIRKSDAIERAFGRVRCCVDDEVVHARLAAESYKVDGEVIKSNFFDDSCTKIPRYLKKLRLRQNDGMAHLDDIGYGELYRSSLLMQAELILKRYGSELCDEHRKKIVRFRGAFRLHRSPESEKADKILDLFKQNDVQTIKGHKEILREWTQMEKLDKFVGVSCYKRCGDTGFTLPYPS